MAFDKLCTGQHKNTALAAPTAPAKNFNYCCTNMVNVMSCFYQS